MLTDDAICALVELYDTGLKPPEREYKELLAKSLVDWHYDLTEKGKDWAFHYKGLRGDTPNVDLDNVSTSSELNDRVREHYNHLIEQEKTPDDAIMHCASRFGLLAGQIKEIIND